MKYLFLLLCPFLFFSCDILRFSLFEVISWTPGEGYHSDPENIVVSIKFSHEPNKISVERNFSLTGDGNRIRGNFLWEEDQLTFMPLTALEKNVDYILTLSAEACDTDGLSMDEAFKQDFTTRADNERPVLVFCYPSMYEVIGIPGTKVKLEFSQPVPLFTLYENVYFTPSMTGFWILENDDKLAIFTPSEPWIQNTRYEIFLSTSLIDKNSMNIRNDFSSIFMTVSDQEKPFLLYAARIESDGSIIQLIQDNGFSGAAELPVENAGWEKDDRLLLVFSKDIDGLSLRNYLNSESSPNLVMETVPGYKTEFIFRFESIPVYESRFTLKIKQGIKDINGNETNEEYIFKIFANGIYSKPPELTGIRIPMSPLNIDNNPIYYSIDSLFEIIPFTDNDYPSGEIVRTWIELYFNTALGAYIDIFSVMELFRTETTNNVIIFSPRYVKTSDFTISDPHPGMEEYQRIEIMGYLTNSTNYGVINFLVAAGLKDNLGNRNENQFKISLIK